MLKKVIIYTDFNDVEKKETHYFNLTKSEIMKMEMSKKGGLAESIQRIIEAEDADASESLRISPGSEYFYFLSKKMYAILLTSFIPFNFFDAILKEN